MIENTSKSTDAHLAAVTLGLARAGINNGVVEAMESAGQQQILESTDLPTQVSGGDGSDAEFLRLGFTFGEPHKHDPLFRPATLPQGWKKVALDHAMGSAIVDELGRERVSVFYKAAYYDRRADMHLNTVFGYLMQLEYEKASPVLDDSWATPAAVAEAAKGLISRANESIALYEKRTDEYSVKRVVESRETIAWAEALIAQVTS